MEKTKLQLKLRVVADAKGRDCVRLDFTPGGKDYHTARELGAESHMLEEAEILLRGTGEMLEYLGYISHGYSMQTVRLTKAPDGVALHWEGSNGDLHMYRVTGEERTALECVAAEFFEALERGEEE